MSTISILLLGLLGIVATVNTIYCNGSSAVSCIESERQALLRFKQDIVDDSNRLSSWAAGDADCCKWIGVVCDNRTGSVIELHLRNPNSDYDTLVEYDAYKRLKLRGKINPSLLDLKHLTHLDLSANDFGGSRIPTFLGSMKSLRHLNLSGAHFQGIIPAQIGKLSDLRDLSLGNEDGLYSNNLNWLSGVPLLKRLYLSQVDLKNVSDWLHMINTLSFLVELRLSSCGLNQIPPLSLVNFSSLVVLDLSSNSFENSLFPEWVFSLNRMVFLDLSYDDFQGPLPSGLKNVTSLKHLDLSGNNFSSSMPDWLFYYIKLKFLSLHDNNMEGKLSDVIGNLSHTITDLDLSGNDFLVESDSLIYIGQFSNLRSLSLSSIKLNQDIGHVFQILASGVSNELESLDLSYCQLSGQLIDDQLAKFRRLSFLNLRSNSISGNIPESLGKLSFLKTIDLSFNKMDGVVTEMHFANLTGLTDFCTNENTLTLKVSLNWTPPFQLEMLGLGCWHLGPRFPLWLRLQSNLYLLNISNSHISDTIPNWFWSFSPNFFYLNLSNNQIQGEIPDLQNALPRILFIDLSSNVFRGRLPRVSYSVLELDISNNLLSGLIDHFLCLQRNESHQMNVLNLGKNFLSGQIPNCWNEWKSLASIMLSHNKFNGSIPSSMGDLKLVESLNLDDNNLSGSIPLSLGTCTELLMVDFSGNKLDGKIPAWIGKKLPKLMFLNLNSNRFRGEIPEELCGLTSIRVLNLAQNNLSGLIPQCFNNFTAMTSKDNSSTTWGRSFFDDVLPTMKVKVFKYSMVLTWETLSSSKEVMQGMALVTKGTSLDYSVGILYLFRSIDLSSNKLSGKIPVEITSLTKLRSLNLSNNFLTGKIPENIGDMALLESLDLSNNQLFSNIPQSMSSMHFLARLNLSYNKLSGSIPSGTQLEGFDESCFVGNLLCGLPLSERCDSDGVPAPNDDGGNGIEESGNGGHEMQSFYWSTVAYGFAAGFWFVIGPLAFSKRWRDAYFQFLACLWHKLRLSIGCTC